MKQLLVVLAIIFSSNVIANEQWQPPTKKPTAKPVTSETYDYGDIHQYNRHARNVAYMNIFFSKCAMDISEGPYSSKLKDMPRINKAYGYMFQLDREPMLKIVGEARNKFNAQAGDSCEGWGAAETRKYLKSVEKIEMLY